MGNMQHLLSQLVQTMGGPTTKLQPDDPFIDSGVLGQMFHAQTITSMTRLQEAIEKLSMAADSAENKKEKAGGKKAAAQGTPKAEETRRIHQVFLADYIR